MNRKYEQRRRAESAAETRRRIVEATVELHRTIGPRQTTVSEVARRAGVERLTVYKHFPDEEAMVRACQSHWLGLHPRPDIESWLEIDDPRERLRIALAQTYAWYEATETMTEKVTREAPALPSFATIVKGWQESGRRSVEILSAGREIAAERRQRFAGTLAVALGFPTWKNLVRQAGMSTDAAIDLACDWVAAAAA
jgi:AcrR family transcriptional regulator